MPSEFSGAGRKRFSPWAFIIAFLVYQGVKALMVLAWYGSVMSAFGPHNHAQADAAFWDRAGWVLEFGPLWVDKHFPQLHSLKEGVDLFWCSTISACFGFLIPLIFYRPQKGSGNHAAE
jgi:hypothetical protein